jgi:hypothetical protein
MGHPKTWIRILAPNDSSWDGQRLSTPEMESLVQNRIPFGIADFCHKIPQNVEKPNNNNKTSQTGKDLKISQAYAAYLCLPVHQNGSHSNLNLSGFVSVEFLGSSKGSSIMNLTAWLRRNFPLLGI